MSIKNEIQEQMLKLYLTQTTPQFVVNKESGEANLQVEYTRGGTSVQEFSRDINGY